MRFLKNSSAKKVHLQFCKKKLLGEKKSTQSDFINWELGRTSIQTNVFYAIINYWFKMLECKTSNI